MAICAAARLGNNPFEESRWARQVGRDAQRCDQESLCYACLLTMAGGDRERPACSPRARKRLCARGAGLGSSGRPLNFTVRPHAAMSAYLKSTWVRVGLGLLVVGATPLLGVIAAADLGLLRDPHPNPVGPGILFGLTLWPAIICIVVGVIGVGSRRAA